MDQEQKWVYESGKHLNICLPKTKLNLEEITKRSFLRNGMQKLEMGKGGWQQAINSNAFQMQAVFSLCHFHCKVCIYNFWQSEIQSSNITSESFLYFCCKTHQAQLWLYRSHNHNITEEENGGVLISRGQTDQPQNKQTTKKDCKIYQCRGSSLIGSDRENRHQWVEVWGLSAETKCMPHQYKEEGTDLHQI